MTVLPIVARELRVASRRASTYWTRFSFGLIAIVVGAFVWGILLGESPRQTGLALFTSLAVVAYIYSLIAGALSTADCVSEEKREGTLGLLFLTDLKSYDIVLGKLAASSVTAIYGLLALFPVMAVPLLLGGVTAAEFWRVVLVCVNNLFLSLALGLICSTVCKDERKAIGLTLLLVFLLTFGWPGLVAWIASELRPGHPLYALFHQRPEGLLSPSPGLACVMAFDKPYKAMMAGAKINWFYVSLIVTHVLGWLALALTAYTLPRVWQDKAATPAVARRQTNRHGAPDARIAFRRRLLDVNPFYWLASRDRFKVVLVWLWLGAIGLIWLVGLIKSRRDWLDEWAYLWTAVLLHSFFKWWMAMEAGRRLGADRKSGALELLLSTPLRVDDILRGQWLALLRQFGVAVALICAVDFLFLGLGFKQSNSDRGVWVAVWLTGMAIFVFDLITLALLTMWLSLTSPKSTHASGTAIVRVCVVPWLIFGAFGAGLGILGQVFGIRPFGPNPSEYLFIAFWFLVSCANNILLSVWSLHRLRTRFRIVAMERPESRAAFWGRWLGRKIAEVKK